MISLKKNLILVFLVFFALSSFASIQMIEPIISTINHGSSVYLGAMQRGETLRISFYKKSSASTAFDSLKLDESLLPANWNYSIEETDQTFNVLITVPANEIERTQKLNFIASREGIEEKFSLLVDVKKNLLVTTIDKTFNVTETNKEVVFSLSIINNSIASHSISISSNLPLNWFKGFNIELKPKEKKEIELVVKPLIYGNKKFYFRIDSLLNGSLIDLFNIQLNVYSTLPGKFYSAFSGFPFFTFNLMPFMLFDAFFSLLG